MAYNKHTWLHRLGTGLNKFKDTITGTVFSLINQPDSITQAGTPISVDWLNEMEAGIEQAHINHSYHNATGTATAINLTVQGAELTDLLQLTFIASANNNGAATTININTLGAKPLYKPNTTTAPNLVAGKAYTVWYDLSNDCFYAKNYVDYGDIAEDTLSTNFNLTRLNKDANDIYTEIKYVRADGTLFKKSVLSGGTSPKYTTRTVTYYELDGTTVASTLTYALNYTDDDLTSEVIQ